MGQNRWARPQKILRRNARISHVKGKMLLRFGHTDARLKPLTLDALPRRLFPYLFRRKRVIQRLLIQMNALAATQPWNRSRNSSPHLLKKVARSPRAIHPD